ncbi:MAG: sigma-70 family RNA polymerase sigma factor [Acidobacteria bacterium]|nr:sigma-70 family RNA polymerase sigma factor [Acidobacteriota bacterium]
MQEQERTMVKRCLQGDGLAWETMVNSYSRRIGGLVYRYSRNREEVEDLTQEIFLRVYRNLNSFRADTGNLNSWMVSVGRNLVIDHLRQSRHCPQSNGSVELEGLNLSDERGPSPERTVARAEASRLLRQGLRLLSPELKEAVVLRYMEEMTYAEIARHLGVPNGTVKSRINRGCARLASLLSKRGLTFPICTAGAQRRSSFRARAA